MAVAARKGIKRKRRTFHEWCQSVQNCRFEIDGDMPLNRKEAMMQDTAVPLADAQVGVAAPPAGEETE